MGPTVTMKVSCLYVSSTQHGLCKKNQKELLRAKLVLVKLMVWLIETGTWLGVLVVVLAAQFVSRCLLKPTPAGADTLSQVWCLDDRPPSCYLSGESLASICFPGPEFRIPRLLPGTH